LVAGDLAGLATFTGWASASPGVLSASEVRVGSIKFPSTGDDIGKFLDAFDTWLNSMIAVEDPGLIVYEAPIISAGKTDINTARKLMGLAGHTEFVGLRRCVPVREVNIGTIKKELAGNGRAEKDAMIAAAKAEGVNVQDEHQADAFGIWKTAIRLYKPDEYRRLFAFGRLSAAAARAR
jgi:Holliday junction resolvasome RuvABC endonuclease subunit